MADPFIGEIRIFAFNYPPRDWAFCRGDLNSVQQNPALYAIIGNTWGGNYNSTFNLPNLQGFVIEGASVPKNLGPGTNTGSEDVTLGMNQTPPHQHPMVAVSPANPPALTRLPAATSLLVGDYNMTAPYKNAPVFSDTTSDPNIHMAANAVGYAGATSPPVAAHENRQPYLTLNFCISLSGYWPYNE